MWFRILLIASAALLHSAPSSRADVATINDAAALEELLVPFNDLLPPLLESDGEQSIASTTTTTAATTRITKRTTTPSIAIKTTPLTTTSATTTTNTPATQEFTKPTKKSYYQQQQQQQAQQIKDLHKVSDENAGAQIKLQDLQVQEQGQKQQPKLTLDIQSLALDLLPPFETVDETAQKQLQQPQQQQQEEQSSNQQAVKLALPKTKVSALTQSKTSKLNVAKQQTIKQQHVAIKPTQQAVVFQQQQQHVAIKPTQQAVVFQQRQQHVDGLPQELLQRYADYFNKQTTKRPPRGPLPTITPFPNRLK